MSGTSIAAATMATGKNPSMPSSDDQDRAARASAIWKVRISSRGSDG